MRPPTQEIQQRAAKEITDKLALYKNLTETRRAQLLEVYRSYITFHEPVQKGWATSFKVNKAHEVVEKILPRIVARNPKWIVSVKNTKSFGVPEDKAQEHANFVQDYLTYIWDEFSQTEPARIWAKNMVVDGKGYAKVKYKYQIARTSNKVEKEELDEAGEPMMNEDGTPVMVSTDVISEEVTGEYPTIDVKNWANVYYDPRFVLLEDRPAFIEEVEGVRFSALWRRKDQKDSPLFNLDKVRLLGASTAQGKDQWLSELRAISGIPDATGDKFDLNNLTVQTYFGYFTKDEKKPEDERLYEIMLVNESIVIGFKEISQNPYVEIKCFEDTKTAFARGFVEPIMGLQDELNYKKNSASEFINKRLAGQKIWSPQSTVDPSTINDPVIVADNAQAAAAHFIDLPGRDINPSFFQEQNDLERQIQSATFTVDTANPRSEQALTNTATGMRIKFFESNSVIEEVRKHFEAGLQQLAYKMLQCAFENMEDNIVFKKQGTQEYWEANKEVLRDAIQKYTIRVEVNSSSFDYIENRRDEAMALYNTLLQAKQGGEPVNTTEALKELLSAFEKADPAKYIQPPNVADITAKLPTGGGGQMQVEPRASQPSPADLTNLVAQGNLQA